MSQHLVSGKLYTPFLGQYRAKSGHFAQGEEILITGSLVLNVGTFMTAHGKPAKSKAVVASLAQVPVTGAGNAMHVNVIKGPLAHQVTIQVRDSALALSTVTAKVNVVGHLGPG